MSILQEALEKELEKLPHHALKSVVIEKLQGNGIDDDDLAARIADHLLADSESFEWEEGPDINLTFDQADLDDVHQRGQKFIDELPDVVGDMSAHLAAGILSGLQEQWAVFAPSAATEFNKFKVRLEKRWGEGLDGLRLTLELNRAKGAEFCNEHQRSRRKTNCARNGALSLLHMRGCQVAAEVILLLENGYANGAMARWRTLFEITTVATLIADAGDALAERYLAHGAVDRKKSLDEYQRCAADLGELNIPARERAAINKGYDAVLRKYGKDFGNPFGWAVGFVGNDNPNPKFNHLQNAAGRASMRIYYKLASFGVHAGAGAFDQQLGTFWGEEPNAAASNAALEQPGANTAYTLTHLRGLLFEPSKDLDEIVMMQATIQLRDKTANAFFNAARKLDRDEQRKVRKAVRRPARRVAHLR